MSNTASTAALNQRAPANEVRPIGALPEWRLPGDSMETIWSLANRVPLNGKIVSGLVAVMRAAAALDANGRRLVSGGCSSEGFPTVHIWPDEKCAEMVRNNEAAYYFEGMEDGVWTRKGQFHFCGARVIWIEKEPN